MTIKIEVNNIYKIFGNDPKSVLPKVEQGMGKEELLEETGHILGINNVSLKIEEGEIFVIMGLSGSGKSTMIRHFNRLIEPTAGKILIDGKNVMALSDAELREVRQKKISMVFQRFGLLPHKTVLQNVSSGLIIGDVPKLEAEEQAIIQIEAVGLAGYEHYYPSQLSGGMQQRVGLARALATKADIMLMDEAFSALDPLIRHDMQGQLLELQKKLNKTIVFITHDLDEALRIGNHIAILKDGQLRQIGTPEEILLTPADDHIARFVENVSLSTVVKLGNIAEKQPTITSSEMTIEKLTEELANSTADVVYVMENDKIIGGVNNDLLLQIMEDGNLTIDALLPVIICSANDKIDRILKRSSNTRLPLAILNSKNQFIGCVSKYNIINAIAK